LGLSLKDNAHSQFPVAVSSVSSLPSKAPITNPAPAVDPVSINEVALELKALLLFLLERVQCKTLYFFVILDGLFYFCLYLRALLVALRTL
jgi:hypothetical protein